MSEVVGYRCPKCGDMLFTSPVFQNRVVCADMGHWAGTLEECEKIDDMRLAFEKWFKDNERRFYTCQFSEEEVAYSAFLAGMKFNR
jgi:acetyl-CoA carboxylase beta subunit